MFDWFKSVKKEESGIVRRRYRCREISDTWRKWRDLGNKKYFYVLSTLCFLGKFNKKSPKYSDSIQSRYRRINALVTM